MTTRSINMSHVLAMIAVSSMMKSDRPVITTETKEPESVELYQSRQVRRATERKAAKKAKSNDTRK